MEIRKDLDKVYVKSLFLTLQKISDIDAAEDTAEGAASQQPSYAKEKLSSMKNFIISRNPPIKPIPYKANNNPAAPLRFLGPQPPEFIMRSNVDKISL